MTSKKIAIVILSLLLFVTLSQTVLAVSWLPLVPCGVSSDNPDTPQDETKPCNQCDLFRLLKNIIDFVLMGLMPPLAMIFFVWGGFLILMGGANPSLISQGKTIFWNTVMGIAIISASWLITNTIIRSIAADNVAPEWWKFECRVTTPVQQPPVQQPPVQQPPTGGNCTGVACGDSNLNVCTANTSASCYDSAVNVWDMQIKAAANANQIGSGIDTVALVKAVMSQESGGRTGLTSFDGSSFGLMQMRPATANSYKSGCTTANITSAWLLDNNNAQTNICIAINYLKSLIGPCGSEIRNIAAGYNGGGADKGACQASTSCASCSVCGSEVTKRWECPWDGPNGEHKICNDTRRDSTTGKLDNFSQTRKYAPSVAYCYSKFRGSSVSPSSGGTGNLTLASISPRNFTAGKESSFNESTGVVTYTYVETPFEISGSNLSNTILSSDNMGVDGKPAIEFKNLSLSDKLIKGTMLIHPTAKEGITKVTVKNSTNSAIIDVTIKITGTQYLKRKFANNPQVSFRGNWSGLMPDQFILDIEGSVRDGLRAISSTNYRQLNINAIIYERKYFHKNFGSCGGMSAEEIAGCSSPLDNIVHIKVESNPQRVANTILHESVHKLHNFNAGIYKGIPNAPITASNFQKEWDAQNIVTPTNFSACPYMPLKDVYTWNDNTDLFHCVFAEPYGAYLNNNYSVFFEDPTTMAALYYFKPESFNSGEPKMEPRYVGKVNVLKKYGFIP